MAPKVAQKPEPKISPCLLNCHLGRQEYNGDSNMAMHLMCEISLELMIHHSQSELPFCWLKIFDGAYSMTGN